MDAKHQLAAGNSLDNPLDELVVDGAQIDQGMLASLLRPYVRLDKGRGRVIFLPGVQERITNLEQVALVLLGQLALSELLEDEEKAGLTPKEVVARTGIAGGSVRPVLRRLFEDGLVVKRGDGGYEVAVHALDRYRHIVGGDA